MAAELVIEPGRQFASEVAFLSEPPGTIGLEVVTAPPKIVTTPNGAYVNLDHHAGVLRRVTKATCQQAWDLARDIPAAFGDSPRGRTRDCDQDVSLAWFVISHAGEMPSWPDPKIDQLDELVAVEGMLDVFGGVPRRRITPRLRRIMERIAWIFDPYTDYRASGEIDRNDPEGHAAIIEQNCQRIERHLTGRGESRPLNMRHEIIGRVGNCAVVQRIGAEALLGVCGGEDPPGAVILWRQRPDGAHNYTYYQNGSPLVPFDLSAWYDTLNEIEGCAPHEGHGGSDTIGGSPLENGSAISPQRMLQIAAENPHIFAHTTPDTLR